MTDEPKQMTDYTAEQLLQSVVQGYDSFAEHWNVTRQNSWYEFELCIQSITPNSSVLDIGCGNGRFAGFLQEKSIATTYEGIDNSSELIALAQKNYPIASFTVGDSLALPYEDNAFDAVVSFAVIHHITPKSNRQKFFAEVARVLKPGGTAFVTTWNVHQQKYKKYFTMQLGTKVLQYVRSPFNVSFGLHDCLIPFGEAKTLRYVHGFTPSELTKLATKDLAIVHTYYTVKDSTTNDWKNCRNICVSLQKQSSL